MPALLNLQQSLKSKANDKKAKLLQRYFKTGKGQYGEGDVFIGITVPEIRKITKKHKDLKLKEIGQLLKSKIHEERLAALLILVEQFKGVMINHNTLAADKIFDFYLKNTKYINNWDLVDLSAPKIIGEYLLSRCKKCEYTRMPRKINSQHSHPFVVWHRVIGLAKSRNIWEKRIAILATYVFIKKNKFEEILKISEMLLRDKHDLIHKAVGWMLREVGKQSQPTLEKFLQTHYRKMPRTMLRYAIERLSERKRKRYLIRDSN